ncbi:hypothetical protein DFH28DRAFT_926553 [Melampsora americana]|nr:hypothetical protein DFH28DRAFT_926553 [Melampsora americana]
MSQQPTLDGLITSGYETDNGRAPPRRSSRTITPARRVPGMIVTPSDSRRGLFDGVRDARDAHVHQRRERLGSLPGDNQSPHAVTRGRLDTISRPSSKVRYILRYPTSPISICI